MLRLAYWEVLREPGTVTRWRGTGPQRGRALLELKIAHERLRHITEYETGARAV
jgi:hypothetical protein